MWKEHNFNRFNKIKSGFDAIRLWSNILKPNREKRGPCQFQSSLGEKCVIVAFVRSSNRIGEYSPLHKIVITMDKSYYLGFHSISIYFGAGSNAVSKCCFHYSPFTCKRVVSFFLWGEGGALLLQNQFGCSERNNYVQTNWNLMSFYLPNGHAKRRIRSKWKSVLVKTVASNRVDG